MNESDGKKTLGLRGGPRSGNVKQSFSHGRTKSVVVETKRKRVMVPKTGTAKMAAGTGPSPSSSKKRPDGVSDAELERRLAAVKAAKAREIEETAKRQAEAAAKEEERRKLELGIEKTAPRVLAELVFGTSRFVSVVVTTVRFSRRLVS